MAPDDAPWVAELIRTAFASIETALDPAPSALGVTEGAIRTHLQTGGGAVSERSGCILWHVSDDGLYIGRLAVLPVCRGQGIASALLSHAEGVARAMGQKRIHLEVRLALAGNRRLFARAGFIERELRAHPGYLQPTYVTAEKRL